MAIDPRIPLGVTPLNLESPTEQMGKAMNLRTAQAQMQSSDLDLQAKERALAEEQQLKALIQSGQPLSERNLFPVVGPVRGASILKGLADLKGAQVKTEGELRAVMGSVIGAIKSLPENMRALGYQTAREGFIQRGWARPEDIPEQYSPELLDQFQQQAMTAEQQTTGARADARFAAEQPGIVADSARKATQAEQEAISLAVSRLQAATNQAEWDIALADAPPAVKRQIPKTFSRAAVSKARQMGLTAEKALSAEDSARRTSIDAARAGEQARHNRVMESRSSEPLEAILGPDGKAMYVPRSQAVGKTPATNRERPSEGERNAAAFYGQMRDALTTINTLENRISENELQLLTSLSHEGVVGRMNRNQLSEDAKRYYRAMMQFTEARLRPVSGAAIADSEYDKDRMTYFKQYGETPALAEDRLRAREGALQNLRMKSGVLAPKDDERDSPGPSEGETKPIPGIPGGEAQFKGGKWVRIK